MPKKRTKKRLVRRVKERQPQIRGLCGTPGARSAMELEMTGSIKSKRTIFDIVEERAAKKRKKVFKGTKGKPGEVTDVSTAAKEVDYPTIDYPSLKHKRGKKKK